MVRNKKPPVALQLPVALIVFALASAAPADDPDRQPEPAEVPPLGAQRTDVLIHEPNAATPTASRVTERKP